MVKAILNSSARRDEKKWKETAVGKRKSHQARWIRPATGGQGRYKKQQQESRRLNERKGNMERQEIADSDKEKEGGSSHDREEGGSDRVMRAQPA